MPHNSGFDKTKKIIIGLIDIVIYHIAIWLSFQVRYQGNVLQFNYQSYYQAIPVIMIAFIFLNMLFGVYILYNKSLVDIAFLTIIIQLLMTVAITSVTFLARLFTFPRSVLLISFILSTLLLFIWRVIVFKLYEKVDGTKRIMVVGSLTACKKAIFNFERSKNSRHKITHMITTDYFKNIKKYSKEVDSVYLADTLQDSVKGDIFNYLIRQDKQMFLNTSFENLVMVNPNIMSIEDESIIEASNFRISPENDIIKRMIDIIVSGVLLLIALPILLTAAIMVKATSPGPVLYKQVRITKNQQEFNILKFRTMGATAEKESGPVLATSNDVRVTKVGKYFRALRIDELPQLINVLKGDMALVGPRPERPFFVDQFKKENLYYDLRHNVRAGITGYAQVYGKYATDFNSKLNFDLLYIKKYSFILDTKILLQTIKILFDKVSSEGVDEEVNVESYSIPRDIKQIVD